MGEVYRATDTKLGRDVALKVLPAEMAQDPERLGRFRREAKALAQLDHPNIVTIHSVEECDGIHFLTMQLVEGLPLDGLIRQGGLPVEQIVDIARALGDALAAAHEKGIVHRDLKPANVMVSNEGRVKVLDFGLAKDVRGSNLGDATLTSDSRTQVGVVMGTPAYMSPEQTSGRPLDHRTDIFSLGVVLHEMATGRRPFEGTSSAELISSIMRDNPPPVTDMRPELPVDLARIIRRCLEKDPRHRVQTARDVSNEFRDLARTTAPAPVSTSAAHARVAAHSGAGQATGREAVREDEGFWVAVLPFKFKGSAPGLDALAEGMTEEIVTGMSRFPYLRVIAHGSTLGYASRAVDLRQVGKELGARYMMEGSLRQSGSRLRIAAQLVDAASGTQLWAETYDRALQPEAIFELQDEVVPRIVSTVGDTQGILAQSMSEAVWNKAPDRLTPYEAVLRSFSYMRRVNPPNHAAARDALERAVEQAPGNGLAWAMLAIIFREEYNHGFNQRPDPLGRALAAARRAVEAEPSNYLTHHALASVQFFRRELEAFRSETQGALRLNPMDGYTFGYLGMLTAFAGDWERGCAMSEKARSLNPQHPGWYWFAPLFDAFRKQEYRLALDLAQKVNMPNFWRTNIALAAIYGHLGEAGPADKALQMLVAARPEFATSAEEECSKWWNADLVDQIVEGLRKAALHKAALDSRDVGAATFLSTRAAPARTASGESRADEGFWVAVLPFKCTGSNADLKALAEGLAEGVSEEVITGFSRFSYLRVIARGSTAKYSSESGDVRVIGKELGARYVMEGSFRQAGTKLRLAVQLVDAVSGAHLWAENYERNFSPEAVFELQDDLVPRIVSTVADINGVLSRSMSEAVRQRAPEQLTPYEAVLRSFGYFERVTAAELNAAVAGIEAALQKAPTYADAWAMLAMLSVQRYAQGFGPAADSLATGAAAARNAVEAAPASHLAWFSLSQVLFFQKEFRTFRNAAERALTLNPMDSNSLALNGEMLALSGEWERGVSLAARARQLNPHHPGWYWHSDFNHAYRQRDYRMALEIASKMNQTSNWGAWALTVAACGQLGDREGAAKAVRELLRLRPDAVSRLREDCDKWFDAKHAAHVMEGFRKAGLNIDAADEAGLSTATASGSSSGASRADEGFWVAVLPFKYAGTIAELKALADGLSEEVITGLSRFSYLRVIARGSTAKYSSEAGDVRTVGKELGARYVMEGSLRQAGSKLRLAVQLVDTASGAHLWAETYERTFTLESVFEVQDDLVPRIVSTVADGYGVLPRTMSEALRSKNEDALSPHEALLRAFSFFGHITPEEHATVRRILERAVHEAPDQADCWAMLAQMYNVEFADEFNPQPNPLDRSLTAAQRAISLAPTHALGYYALAFVYFFRKEIAPFRAAAERALTLNPMDGYVLGQLGILMDHTGDLERGGRMVETAMQLNPNHPRVLRFTNFVAAYRQGKYAEALEAAVRINMPGFFHFHAVLAATLGQLGQREAANKALRDVLALRPDFATEVRRDYSKWWKPDLVERMVEGLRKAGLDVPDANGPASSSTTSGTKSFATSSATSTSSFARTDEGFWVAVLPFKYTGTNADLKALAEGSSDEVITGLSRFSYLRVIARGSTAKYSSESGDVRVIGKELGARYVMEGSLRQAGSKLRLAVQLVDTTPGTHLWAETFERTFTPDDIFALQDDLVPRIVSTVADQYGILPRSMSEILRTKKEEDLTPHEAVLRTFSYFTRITPEEHAAVGKILERAVRDAPDHADSWAMLSMIYRGEFAQGFNAGPNPLDRALAAAQRAVDLAATHALGHYALATVYFFRKEMIPFRVEAERALALNPLDASARAYLGLLTAAAGDWDRGCQMVESAMQLNPNCPGYFYFARCCNGYRQGRYAEVLEAVARVNMPNYFHTHAMRSAALGQLGRREEARKALQDLLALRPDFAAAARQEYAKWYDSELIEQLIDGLRKAGLEIPESG
jgi:TolB-like protein/Tfp pilus assembly protein PilF